MAEQPEEKPDVDWDEDWETAKIIYGNLVEIDRNEAEVILEYKDEYDEWVKESFSIATLTDEESKGLLSKLGRELFFTIVDKEITEISG